MVKISLQHVYSKTLQKRIFKFEDGILVKEFMGLTSAAFDAGIPAPSMSLYITGKIKKPKKVAANLEYSYSNKLK